MITEQLIRQNQTRHQELLREAAVARQIDAGQTGNSSVADKALAGAGDLLVTVGQSLQRRYRRVEEGVGLGGYTDGQQMGRAL